MAESMNRGFSLIEVLIITVLLGLLSMSLVHSAINMRTLLESMEHQIDKFWLRQTLVSYYSASEINESPKLVNHSSKTFYYVDLNNDGKDDTWLEKKYLTADLRLSYSKSESLFTWSDTRSDVIISEGISISAKSKDDDT